MRARNLDAYGIQPGDTLTLMDLACIRPHEQGRARTLPVYEEAIVERHDRCINTYDYTLALSPPNGRLVPFTGTPEEVCARARRNREKVSAVSRRARVGRRPGTPCATRLSTTSTSRIRLNPADPCRDFPQRRRPGRGGGGAG